MAAKLGRMVTSLERLPPIKSHDHNYILLNHYTSTTIRPTATKLGKVG